MWNLHKDMSFAAKRKHSERKIDGQFLIACIGVWKNKCCCCSLRLALHENRSRKLFCIKTLLENVDTALYLSLLSAHFTWDCCQWTLLETASNELCLRLHPINFTWGCIQWTLLGPVATELYWRLLSVNLTQFAIIALCILLETALNQYYFKLNACNLFLRENLIIFYFFQEKCHKFLTHFWRTFDALSTHFWRTFDTLLMHF